MLPVLWKLYTWTLSASFAWFSLSIFSGVMKWLVSTVSTPCKIRIYDHEWKWAINYDHYLEIHQQFKVTSFFMMNSTCMLLLRNLCISICILSALRGPSYYVTIAKQSQSRPHEPRLIDHISTIPSILTQLQPLSWLKILVIQ